MEEAIVKSGPASEFGWVARTMDVTSARKWMTETLAIPGPVQSFVLLPHVRNYERTVTKPFNALLAGATEYVLEPAPGCACSVM